MTTQVNKMTEEQLQDEVVKVIKAICECWPELLKEHPVRHMLDLVGGKWIKGFMPEVNVEMCLSLVREYNEVSLERARQWEHSYDDGGGHTVTTSFYCSCCIGGDSYGGGYGSGPTLNVAIVRAWLNLVLPAIEKAKKGETE